MFSKKRSATFAHLGLDISDGSLELAYIPSREDSVHALTLARVILPPETIIHGLINEERSLREAMLELYAQAQLLPEDLAITTALPDVQVLTTAIPLTQRGVPGKKELTDLANDVAKEHARGELVRWTYGVAAPGASRLVVFQTRKEYIDQWKSFFKSLHIPLNAIEMESLALRRSLTRDPFGTKRVGILDIGYRTSSLSIFDNAGLAYSSATEIGGLHITTMLQGQFQISTHDAEQLKYDTSINPQSKSKAAEAIRNKLDHIFKELELYDSLKEYQSERLILTGGNSLLTDLKSFLSHKKISNAELGKLMLPEQQHLTRMRKLTLAPNDHPLYAGAIGLALRDLFPTTDSLKINFCR